jgi:hypothetical protein
LPAFSIACCCARSAATLLPATRLFQIPASLIATTSACHAFVSPSCLLRMWLCGGVAMFSVPAPRAA